MFIIDFILCGVTLFVSGEIFDGIFSIYNDEYFCEGGNHVCNVMEKKGTEEELIENMDLKIEIK